MRTTLKDVAKLAGVSVSTVAMVLNDRGKNYSESTRQKVKQAAEQVNYRAHVSARGLRMNKSFLIGVSIFEGNSFLLSKLVRGIQQHLIGGEYSILLQTHASQEEERESHRLCRLRQVDGMIVNPGYDATGHADARSYLETIGQNVPLVEVFGRALTEAPSVNVDDVSSGRIATEHLLSLGHRRIVMLTHDRYQVSKGMNAGPHLDAWRHFEGYEQAMRSTGAEVLVLTHPLKGEIDIETDFHEGGYRALDAILNHPARPTAVVCYNDFEAYGLATAAHHKNIEIPRQLSIVGYGDLEASRLRAPTITSLQVPAFEVGKRAAESLLGLMNNQSFEDTIIRPTLVVRDSTGRVA